MRFSVALSLTLMNRLKNSKEPGLCRQQSLSQNELSATSELPDRKVNLTIYIGTRGQLYFPGFLPGANLVHLNTDRPD